MGILKWTATLFAVCVVLVSSQTYANCGDLAVDLVDPSKESPFSNENWLHEQERQSFRHLANNVSPAGALPGTVLASTSSHYRFHWVRDAAIVMSVLPESKMEEFLALSRTHQLNSGPENLGEAKYLENGLPYEGPWARPQNDGPAIRAAIVSEYILEQLHKGLDPLFVKRELFSNPSENPDLKHKSHVLWDDLQYILKYWETKESADIWEEIFARGHAYTLMSFESAFTLGEKVAERLGEYQLASELRAAKHKVESYLNDHKNAQGQIESIRGMRAFSWNPHKDNFDASTILGVLYFENEDSLFKASSPEVLATAQKLIQDAREDYPVLNNNRAAPAIGRYRGDAWNGYERGDSYSGNPWTLVTAAFAELHYRVAIDYLHDSVIKVTNENVGFLRDVLNGAAPSEVIRAVQPGTEFEPHQVEFAWIVKTLSIRGDQYLKRVQDSAGGDGSLSEQISKMDPTRGVGPENLSWSHVQVLRAFQYRKRLLRYL